MDKFIGTYKGASIFEKVFKEDEGEQVGAKMVAKATLPGGTNLKVDFIEEADNREQAYDQIRKAIDSYLVEHEFIRFEE